MKSLGAVLRKAIEQSGYSIYKVAGKAGINRTTLQKILSDERPVSTDMLKNILSVLRLSSSEETEILTAFEIYQSGETLYSLRQLTRQFLVDLFNADRFFLCHKPIPKDKFMPWTASACIEEQILLSSSYQIEEFLDHLITLECAKDAPCIRINLPGSLPLIHDFFIRSLLSKSLPEHLKILHITQFLRSSNAEKDSLTNLGILSKLLPVSLLTSLDYQIHYFYDSQFHSDTWNLAFPYYILFSDTVLLLSADGSAALPCTEEATIRYFRHLFDGALRNATPLIEMPGTASEFLNYLLAIDTPEVIFHSIEYQPCLVTFLPEELFYQYARQGFPNRDALIQAIILRSRQLYELKNRSCIFSKSGLLEFASTGFMTDLPSVYALPLSVQDRILVLKRLYSAIQTGQQDYYMTNPVTFPLPPRLTCIIRNNIGVEFCYFNQNLAHFKRIHIKEHTILDTFEDFFQYSLRNPFIYTREETMEEVLACIQELERTVSTARCSE